MIDQKKKYTKVEILEQTRHLGMALAESETLEAAVSLQEGAGPALELGEGEVWVKLEVGFGEPVKGDIEPLG